MFSSSDLSVTMAIIVLISSALLSVVYGIAKWNKEGDITKDQLLNENLTKEDNSTNGKEGGKL